MKNNIVLIADRVPDFSHLSLMNRNLECIPPQYFNDIYSTLSVIGSNVIHYNSPKEFCKNISKHKNDIVLSIWSGIGSKYRKALIPSICEANNLCYVGADPYVHFLSQDKYLTKRMCSHYGISSARDMLYCTSKDSSKVFTLRLPLVVKPNYEGGSNGISSQNLVYDYNEAITLADKLKKIFNQPILIEEYIEGIEICISIIGTSKKIDMLEASKLIINDTDYFHKNIYSYEPKVKNVKNRSYESATELLSKDLIDVFLSLFKSLGKVELLRIDGRIDCKGNFKLIELTPDAYLGKRGSTTFCANNCGIDYEQMLRFLLTNAYSNYKERIQLF